MSNKASDPHAIWPEGMTAQAGPLAMSPGITAGDFVFVTGMTGSAPDGAMPDDPQTQFQAIFAKLADVLHADDLTLDHVVDMTSYHIDIQRTFDTFADVHAQHMRRAAPAWTAVGVSDLRRPGALAEVKVTAYRPQNRAGP